MEKILFFFTESFPYGKGESFIENEIEFLCESFQKVIIVPSVFSGRTEVRRTIPPNAVVFALHNISKVKLLLFLPLNLSTIAKAFIYDFVPSERNLLKKIKLFKRELRNILWALHINSKLEQAFDFTNVKFYSYWMNVGALALSLRKMKRADMDFIVRVHGYDLYLERSEYGMIPFQQLNCRFAKCILPVSHNGQEYLKNIRPHFASKIISSYLGVPDRGINIIPKSDKPTPFVIVSCSFMVPLKRIDLIVRALMLLEMNVTWVHLGDGPEMGKIKGLCQKLPMNISYKLMGSLKNCDVIDFYRNNPVNLFIHLSETEAVPVAIMEASSFGIPILATDVGGVGELVGEETGILVKRNITPEEVASSLKIFFSSSKNTPAFRERVRNFWNINFNASRNYNDFINAYLSDH